MSNREEFTREELKQLDHLIRLRRECLFDEVQQLSTTLHGLTNSYRLLIGAAEEFNKISFSSKDDVDDAVDRADDLGDLIDSVIDVLEIKLKMYLKHLKKVNICEKEWLYCKLKEEDFGELKDLSKIQNFIFLED